MQSSKLWLVGTFLTLLGVIEFIFVIGKQAETIKVSDQPLGETIKIDSVTFSSPGFYVIKKKNNNPQANSGRDLLLFPGPLMQKGIYKDFWVNVPFDSENKVADLDILPGEVLVVGIIKDDGDGIYNPVLDKPFKNIFRMPIEQELILRTVK